MSIAYFTKQYQAVPALMQLYQSLGGAFVTTRGSTARTIRKVYPGVRVEVLHESMGRFSAGERYLRQAKLIVTGSSNRELFSRYAAHKCMVFHGTYAFMSQREIDSLRHFDLICTIGPRMREALLHADLQGRLLDVGYLPFMEFPKRDAVERQRFLQSLGLNPDNKTLLYLPRGRPYGSWDVMAKELLLGVPSRYNLILRPHPSQSVTARIRDRFGFMRLERLARTHGNALIDLTECRLSSLFSVADLVISDGASSPEESLFYDLPQVLIESTGSSPTALAAMMRGKGISEDYIGKLLTIYQCGKRIAPDSPDMLAVIESAMAEAEDYQTQRATYFNWIFGERGMDRQTQLIRDLRQYV